MPNTRHFYSLLLSSLLLLAGCSTKVAREDPAPVEDRGTSEVRTTPLPPSGEPGEEVEITAYRPPAPMTTARPEPGRAVQVLMRRAQEQRQEGQLVAAVGSLERALRIEPRNPVIWNQLAHVRMDQRQYRLAADLAAKSNSLVGSFDAKLKQNNNELIRQARHGKR